MEAGRELRGLHIVEERADIAGAKFAMPVVGVAGRVKSTVDAEALQGVEAR